MQGKEMISDVLTLLADGLDKATFPKLLFHTIHNSEA
jgi:hypothetical protein